VVGRALALGAAFGAMVTSSAPAASDPVDRAPAAQADGRAADAVDKLAAEVKAWGGSLGVFAIDVETGGALVARGEHAPLNPASNAKLATAAAALRTLGPGHRFVTGLYGKITKDAVDKLVLRGDGDPSLGARDVRALAHELKAFGVKRVRALLVDQSAFDDRYVPPAFEQQPNEWAAFRAPVSPVSLDENTVTFTVRPTKRGENAVVAVDPPGLVEVAGSVATTAKGDAEKVTLSLEPRGSRLAAKLGGTAPEGRAAVFVRRVDDPRLLAGLALRAALAEEGIEAPAPALGGERERRLLASHLSPRLAELLFALGKDSDNFYAETIFKAMAAKKRGEHEAPSGDAPAAATDAAEVVTRELSALHAFEPGVVIKNGSGLFDANRTTPWALAELLRSAYRASDLEPEMVAQLSIGGVDGTLHGRFKSWAATRAIRAKTGTLDAVAALSGYVLGPPGKSPVAFAIVANGISGHVGAARPLMDKVVEALAEQRWQGVAR
jgi:D-alanyl-D-alanine carboxypeptidase/D-alanyl-D-alanine-endopeptidase (penicillin-binding protein 4)